MKDNRIDDITQGEWTACEFHPYVKDVQPVPYWTFQRGTDTMWVEYKGGIRIWQDANYTFINDTLIEKLPFRKNPWEH